MGYFDGLADAVFKKNAAGQTVYYPWGIFGKGYVIESEEQKERIRSFMKKNYYVILPVSIVLGLLLQRLIRSGSYLPFLGILVVSGGAYIAYFHFQTKKLLSEAPLSTEKLSLWESYRNSASSHNLATLIVLEIFSIGFVIAGFFLLTVTYNVLLPALCIGIFGLCSIAIGYMILSKLKKKP